jgi:hypothetical protein
VGIDRPDDADVPPDKDPDRPVNRPPAETRYRQECYDDLRAATEQPNQPPTRSKPAGEQTENAPSATSWEENAEQSRWMWTEYKRRWPPEERPPVDRSKDPPGTWRGEGGQVLEPADNARIEAACDLIADREEKKISPTLRAIESQDPDRYLIGLKDCLKGRDRIKEKVYDDMDLLGRSPHEAISLLPDAIRYTFQYDEARYTQSVWADVARLKDQGFKLDKLKNSWSDDDQYKGINSQWIHSGTSQRIEVQFHTRISFEAKQITHGAYERLRTRQADAFEELVLEAFQRKVSAEVPVPSGATEIPDYQEGEWHAR